MSKSDPKQEAKISISVSPTGFRRRMLFNRFFLQPIDAHILAYFGLVDDSGFLRDQFVIGISKQTIEDSKASLTSFLTRIGSPTTTQPKWVPPSIPTTTELANVINAGVSTDGEILFSSFAIGPAISKTKESQKPIDIDPIAMLRCDPELLKLFIVELYTSEKIEKK